MARGGENEGEAASSGEDNPQQAEPGSAEAAHQKRES